jgi:hypothetical protein
MITIFYTVLVFAILVYFMVAPKRSARKPPHNDDDGGEPRYDDLPDLDLPPGITRPVNDWEPDYNRRRDRHPA